jgi:predicted GNAT superfamily acetyltransferase
VDRAAILALNNTDAVHTSLLTADRLDALISAAFHVGLVDEGRTSFLLAFDQAADYHSPNFRWFQARYRRFTYVDRIVTAAASRGRGHGRALYQGLFEQALAQGHDQVGCEVNIEPPNAGSDRFHAALGFEEVGRATPFEGKVVRYMLRTLAATPETRHARA